MSEESLEDVYQQMVAEADPAWIQWVMMMRDQMTQDLTSKAMWIGVARLFILITEAWGLYKDIAESNGQEVDGDSQINFVFKTMTWMMADPRVQAIIKTDNHPRRQ